MSILPVRNSLNNEVFKQNEKGSNAVAAVRVDKKVNDSELTPIIELDGVNAVNYISLQ